MLLLKTRSLNQSTFILKYLKKFYRVEIDWLCKPNSAIRFYKVVPDLSIIFYESPNLKVKYTYSLPEFISYNKVLLK